MSVVEWRDGELGRDDGPSGDFRSDSRSFAEGMSGRDRRRDFNESGRAKSFKFEEMIRNNFRSEEGGGWIEDA